MPITNDQELARAVAQASIQIQEIQDYCGKSLKDQSKVNFPRGLIGTADSYRGRCPNYLSTDQISSCAYGFMYLDVLWWLLSRTDLASVGKQMCVKSAIITLGMLVEVVLWIPTLPRDNVLSKKCTAGVIPRLKSAIARGWINEEQGACLENLWNQRNNVHLKFLENSERDLYQVDHINAPHDALLVLMANLRLWHQQGASAS